MLTLTNGFCLLCFSVPQVLYQAVNYQMEPVITETGPESDETDSVKVCIFLYSCFLNYGFPLPLLGRVWVFCLGCVSHCLLLHI